MLPYQIASSICHFSSLNRYISLMEEKKRTEKKGSRREKININCICETNRKLDKCTWSYLCFVICDEIHSKEYDRAKFILLNFAAFLFGLSCILLYFLFFAFFYIFYSSFGNFKMLVTLKCHLHYMHWRWTICFNMQRIDRREKKLCIRLHFCVVV